MIVFFKSKFVIYLFSAMLFFSFALKTSTYLGKQWSVMWVDMDDEHPNEKEQQSKKEDQRMLRKAWYFQWPESHSYFSKEPANWEAHNNVYLLAIITEPLIAIITQPPEFV